MPNREIAIADKLRRRRIKKALQREFDPFSQESLREAEETRKATERERKVLGWSYTNSPLLVGHLIPDELFSRQHLNVLLFGGHQKEASDVAKILKENGFDSKTGKTYSIHQTGLTSRYQSKEAVFHEGVTTRNVAKIGKKFDLIIAQNSFYAQGTLTTGLLQIHKSLAEGGSAIIYFHDEIYRTQIEPYLRQIADLCKNRFSMRLVPVRNIPDIEKQMPKSMLRLEQNGKAIILIKQKRMN